MHILYSFPLRLGRTGIGSTAWHQVSGLVNQDVKVSLFCGSCEKPISNLEGLRKTLVPWGLKLPIRLLGRKRAAELHDKIVARAIGQIHEKSKIDIIHCWPSGALATLERARELGIKTILERPSAHTRYVFEIARRECQKLGIKSNRSHYAAFNQQRLLREEREFEMADRLLCPSDFVVKTFLERGFERKKLCRHQYGYDPSVFSTPRLRNSQTDESPFRLLYVGDCSPLKGLHYALQAWLQSRASQKGKFVICGGMAPEYRKVIRKWLDHPSVEYLGFVQNIAEIMRNCDALILPSLGEGSALVTYEARACGCVLLVSEAGGAVCEHMKDGLIHTPGDVKTLRDHIDLLASDKVLLDKLRKNSLNGLPDLTWAKATQVLIKIYQESIYPYPNKPVC